MAENLSELNAMKVTDLKKMLKEKGLPVSGNKAELVDRLKDIQETKSATSASQSILTSAAVKSAAAPKQISAVKTQSSTSLQTAQAKHQEHVVKNGTVGATKQLQTVNKVSAAAKPTQSDDTANNDPLSKRAQRFGVMSDDAKLKARAERFQISRPTSSPSSATKKTKVTATNAKNLDFDLLKKRAERFQQIVSPSYAEAEKIQKAKERAERFGISDSASPTKVLSKAEAMEKRKERFGSSSLKRTSASDDSEAKRKRAERFGLAS